jgi:hypothetical protein
MKGGNEIWLLLTCYVGIILLILLSCLALSLSSCSVIGKSSSKSIVDSAYSHTVIKSDSLLSDSSKTKFKRETSVAEKETQYDKETVIEDFSPEGTLTKRTVTKEKGGSKEANRKEKQVIEHNVYKTKAGSFAKEVEQKIVSSTTVQKNKSKWRFAWWLLLIPLGYIAYRKFKCLPLVPIILLISLSSCKFPTEIQVYHCDCVVIDTSERYTTWLCDYDVKAISFCHHNHVIGEHATIFLKR